MTTFNLFAVSIIWIIFSLISPTISWSLDDMDPVVNTRYGQVRGRKEVPVGNYQSDLRITSFIGIPYAAPPTGIRRFADPREPDRWTGVSDCTNRRVMCPQVDQRFKFEMGDDRIGESEDCLYLNIQVLARGTAIINAPVVVYIHGGEFKYGGKDFYSLDSLPSNVNGLVLVTINYRLGPLGFLSTDTNSIHGNFGLRDMIMALRFVQSEISQFHGDTNSVILVGHDAGAIAANMLMLSLHNEVLFNAVVSSGGTVFTPWAFEHQPSVIARELSHSMGCSSSDTLRCLRNKSVFDMFSAARTKGLHFRPTIDSNLSLPLFRSDPETQFRNGYFARVPFIVGISEQEGALDYYRNYRSIMGIGDKEEKIRYLIAPFVRRYANLNVLASLAHYQYFPEEEARMGRQSSDMPISSKHLTTAQTDERLVQMLGDYLYNLPAEKALFFHSQYTGHSKFFVYEDKSSRPTFGMLQRNLPPEVTRDKFRATHMDDISLLFKTVYTYQYNDLNPGSNSLLLCILSSVHNKNNPCAWNDYRSTSRSYLRILRSGQGNAENFRSERLIAFWNHLFSTVESSTVVIPPYFPTAEFQSYQAATWSLTAIVVILLIIAIGLAAVIYIARRNDKRSLKLIRKRNEEFTEKGDVVERL